MLHDFLINHRDELVDRCKAKVALRRHRTATDAQLENGIPMFLDQLARTLLAEQDLDGRESLQISGSSGGDPLMLSEIGVSAATHGKMLLTLGYTVDHVVHDYGDLCQAITDLAFERDAPFAIDEFRTMNRCLDNAIADAVKSFSALRDSAVEEQNSSESNQRLGSLVHELRNWLQMAMLATRALEAGSLPVMGATGTVLQRSHVAMKKLIEGSLVDIRLRNEAEHRTMFSLASFIHDTHTSFSLDATARGCSFDVEPVDPALQLHGNRDRLLGALANLLGNAFKFSHAHGRIGLAAYRAGDRILIDVADSCGGLVPKHAEKMFAPFLQFGEDRTGLGLGLSIARQAVESDGGTLTVKNLPGIGCVFTIDMPDDTPGRGA